MYGFYSRVKGNKFIAHDFSYNWWLLQEPFVLRQEGLSNRQIRAEYTRTKMLEITPLEL